MPEITIRISDRTLKVALAVLGGLFLVWGFAHFWSLGTFRPKYQIQIFVPEAEGIRVGAAVRLDGLPIGSVSSVELADRSADSNRRIEVALRIEKRFQNMIRDDSTASLVSIGILSDRSVSIQRGFTGRPINPGGEIRFVSVKGATFTDFMDAIEKKAHSQDEEKNIRNDKSSSDATKPQKAH